jgi:hypothetical protein
MGFFHSSNYQIKPENEFKRIFTKIDGIHQYRINLRNSFKTKSLYEKFKFFLFLGAFAFSLPSLALDSQVKLKGSFDFKSFFIDSNGSRSQKMASTNKNHFALLSSGNLYLDYALIAESGLKYGTKLGLELNFRNDRTTPMSIYMESNYGKLEVGSDMSAGNRMKITGYSAALGGAGMWDMFIKTSPNPSKISYVTSFASFLDAKMRASGYVEYSRKITYFTPSIRIAENHQIQLGASYIPDSSNMGIGETTDLYLYSPIGASIYKFSVKNGLSYGVKHKFTISENTSLSSSFVGEVGTPIAYEKDSSDNYTIKSAVNFKRLNLSLLASDSDYNQSITSSVVDKLSRDAKLYSLGAKYKIGKTELGIMRFYSDYKKNKINAYSLGADYALAPGIKTYASVVLCQTNGRFLDENNQQKFDKSKSTLLILGARINL